MTTNHSRAVGFSSRGYSEKACPPRGRIFFFALFQRIRLCLSSFCLASLIAAAGCMKPKIASEPPQRPDVTPTEQPSGVKPLTLDASHVKPMYTEMIAVDLSTVVKAAVADNLDIQQARQAVEASRGRYESTIGAAFPAIVPTALFEHVDGTVRATEGNLTRVGFNTFQPSIAVQWVGNPGRVYYDIAAAKKRLAASEQQEQAVMLETLRRSADGFYDLVLMQARVSAAHQGVKEAQELLRISTLRLQTGTGVHADQLRAQARLAQRQQELIAAMHEFYQTSVSLAVVLRLDAAVTLVPGISSLPPIQLVKDDLTIETLLEAALTFRPDLESVRTLAQAVAADKGAAWWGAWGPQFELKYQYGGITGHANNIVPAQGIPGNLIVNPATANGSFSPNPLVNGVTKESILRGSRRLEGRDDQTFAFSDQQRASAGAGWRLSFAAFGDLKTANARRQQAVLAAQRRLDEVKAQVVAAAQASRANRDLITLAQQQVASAQEALRLSEAHLQAGQLTLLDVLQSQDAATQARLRYAQAVVRYNQSQVDLLAALGLLNETTLTPTGADDSTGD